MNPAINDRRYLIALTGLVYFIRVKRGEPQW